MPQIRVNRTSIIYLTICRDNNQRHIFKALRPSSDLRRYSVLTNNSTNTIGPSDLNLSEFITSLRPALASSLYNPVHCAKCLLCVCLQTNVAHSFSNYSGRKMHSTNGLVRPKSKCRHWLVAMRYTNICGKLDFHHIPLAPLASRAEYKFVCSPMVGRGGGGECVRRLLSIGRVLGVNALQIFKSIYTRWKWLGCAKRKHHG